MRDGTVLVADVYPPAGYSEGDPPAPAVLARTPYNRAAHIRETFALNQAGYWVVIQDVRGRGDSEGEFVSYFNEGDDGFDSVEWVAGQPWCDGNVGMMGGSYRGWVQWAAAREQPPHLKAFVSTACCASWTGEWPWTNGVLWPGAVQWVHMTYGHSNQPVGAYPIPPHSNDWTPLKNSQLRWGRYIDQAEAWMANPVPGEYWDPITFGPDDFASIDVPVLHLTGWFDGCQRGSHMLFEGMRRHSPAADRQQLVVGAWDHGVQLNQRTYDGVDFGDEATIDFFGEHIAWYDRWLRSDGTKTAALPETPARIFRTGVNRWTTHEDFPTSEATPTPYYLRADGRLELEPATGDEPVDRWRYDPDDPVPTSDGTTSYPKLDRSAVLARDDVETFRSDPLDTPVAFSGRPFVEIYAEADVADTDWFVEVFDEDPDGGTMWVTHGRLRARFRSGLDREEFMEPGAVHGFGFDLTPRAHQFGAGHRIGVAVMNSGAPLWAPNPNGGGDIYTQSDKKVASLGLHHSEQYRSNVSLPIVKVI